MLVMMLALTGVVMAEDNTTATGNDTTQGQALSVRYDNMQCKVVFTNTQIDLLQKYVSVDQTANKDKLTSDMTTLKAYVDNANKDGFDTYITDTLRPDLQKVSQDLTNVKKNFKQHNISNESKTALISELKDAKNVYSACVNDKEVKMANVMETHMENWNRQWGKIIGNMNKKNITMEDATALQAEINAKNEELKALIAEGNITKIRDFMKTYHDDQLHYAARFEIARLNGYKNKLAPLADKYNMTGEINDINKRIANAEKYAQPGYKFKEGEFNSTWENIRGAGQDIKDIAKGIAEQRVIERQGRIAERQQKIDNKTERLQNRQGPRSRTGNLNDNNSGDQ
jgi:hypothetical protein